MGFFGCSVPFIKHLNKRETEIISMHNKMCISEYSISGRKSKVSLLFILIHIWFQGNNSSINHLKGIIFKNDVHAVHVIVMWHMTRWILINYLLWATSFQNKCTTPTYLLNDEHLIHTIKIKLLTFTTFTTIKHIFCL